MNILLWDFKSIDDVLIFNIYIFFERKNLSKIKSHSLSDNQSNNIDVNIVFVFLKKDSQK